MPFNSREFDIVKAAVSSNMYRQEQHQDDAAVDALAAAMKVKLSKQRAKGYGGWDTPECTQQRLSDMLREHVDKGDPVDVANFCAFLAARGEGITQAAPAAVAGLSDLQAQATPKQEPSWFDERIFEMTAQQPEALWLADEIESRTVPWPVKARAASELRRLYAENITLQSSTAPAAVAGLSDLQAQATPKQEPSCTAVKLAEMVLSDCGHSSNNTGLLDRVSRRIDAHVEGRLDELRICLESKPAPQQKDQKPYAYAVYFSDQPAVELVHDLDELTDDLTNREHQITKLYTAPQAAPAAQGDAPPDSGPISRQWLTVVYRGVEAGDEVQQICTHPKVSAMRWSHAIHDRDAGRSQAKEGGA